MNSEQEHTRAVCALNIQPGDFVQRSDEYGDVWHEVKTVWETSVVLYVHRSPGPGRWYETEIVFFSYLRPRVHRKGEPWSRGEACYVMDATGRYGGRNDDPLPSHYKG